MIELFLGSDFGEPAVRLNTQSGVADIRSRQKSRNAGAGVGANELGLIRRDKVEAQINFQTPARFLPFNLNYGLLEQLTVQIESDRHDVSALGRSKNAAGAANLQVAHGDAKTGAERTVLFDGVNALACRADRHHLAREQ